MTRTKKLMGAVSATALIAMSSTQAQAAGVTAGASIQNTVTVGYRVGGTQQTAVQASDTFVVDRKVNVTISEVGNTTTSVSPGQVQAVTTFDVTNLSNAVVDLALTVAQQTGGAGAHSNTDTFNVTNVKIYRDNGATTGVYDSTDTEITYLDEVSADATARVFVVASVPLQTGSPVRNLSSGDVAAVTLTANAHASGTANTLGAKLVASTGANTSSVETVLADAAGATDGQYDGAFSAKDDYTVLAASLSVVKISSVISDPVNGTTNPKLIPGAIVQYCIAVSNSAGATAQDIAITDVLPAEVAYLAAFGVLVNGTYSNNGTAGNTADDTCTAGTGTGAYNTSGRQVSGTLSDLDAGDALTLVFRATINAN